MAGSSAHIHFITVGLPVTYCETIFITYFSTRFFGNRNTGAEYGTKGYL